MARDHSGARARRQPPPTGDWQVSALRPHAPPRRPLAPLDPTRPSRAQSTDASDALRQSRLPVRREGRTGAPAEEDSLQPRRAEESRRLQAVESPDPQDAGRRDRRGAYLRLDADPAEARSAETRPAFARPRRYHCRAPALSRGLVRRSAVLVRDGAPLVRRQRRRDDAAGRRQHSRSGVPPPSRRGAGAAEHPGPGARPGARTPAARDGRRRARATLRRAGHVARGSSLLLLGPAERRRPGDLRPAEHASERADAAGRAADRAAAEAGGLLPTA